MSLFMTNLRSKAFRCTLTATTFLGAAAMSLPAYAEWKSSEIKIGTGLDSNPFRFADDISNTTPEAEKVPSGSAQYLKYSAKTRYDFDGPEFLSGSPYISGRVSGTQYESDFSDADSLSGKLGLGYQSKFKWGKTKARYKAELSYALRDKTYISRFSETVGEIDSTLVPDYYDYQTWRIDQTLQLRLSKAQRLYFNLDVQDKNYEDFSNPEITNLDYLQPDFSIDWQMRFGKPTRLTLTAGYKHRIYDDREADDASGSDVAGSALEYATPYLGLSFRHDLTDAWRLSFKAKYERQRDNEVGYADIDKARFELGLRYQPNDLWLYRASVAYSDSNYVSRIEQASEEEGQEQERGLNAKASARRYLGEDKHWFVEAVVRANDLDSSTPEYVYDRVRGDLSVGLKF